MKPLVAALPGSGAAHDEAITLARTIQLALRGAADMTLYAPSSLPQVPDD
ncbi:hypothetical protein KQH60_09620 [Mycetohabitans sp. B8]|nr:hypothetical protein [Mycetohabitans sp. B8]MCG1042781.1 hypothetical protein [Mycetohabitans sp. B8]